jgi:hypothetical protein
VRHDRDLPSEANFWLVTDEREDYWRSTLLIPITKSVDARNPVDERDPVDVSQTLRLASILGFISLSSTKADAFDATTTEMAVQLAEGLAAFVRAFVSAAARTILGSTGTSDEVDRSPDEHHRT